MPATTTSYGPCPRPNQFVQMERYQFKGVAVKCIFECKAKKYTLYRNLHKHYMTTHNICLHRVTQIEPDNQEEWLKEVTEVLAPLRLRNSRGLSVPPQGNRPLAANPLPQLAGPSGFGGHKMPVNTTILPAPSNFGREHLLGAPSWCPASIPIGNPDQHHIPSLRPPFLSEVGPSRSPAPHLTTRHRPYPEYSPTHDQAKGNGREIPSAVSNHGLPTPDTSWTFLERITTTIRPHDEVPVRSPSCSSAISRRSGSPRLAAGILVPILPAQVSRYPTGATVSDNLHRPVTTRERSSFGSSTCEHKGSMPGHHARNTQPQYQQLQTVLHSPAMHLPTPLMRTSSLPENPPRLPKGGERELSPQRANQKNRLGSLDSPITLGPPRYAMRQSVSHPYARPANGLTTSELARQAREHLLQETQTEASTSRETPVHCASPFVGGQVLPKADVLREQDHTGDITPDLLKALEKETPVLLADRQGHRVDSPIEPTTSQLPFVHDLLQIEGSSCVVYPSRPRSSASAPNYQIQPRESPKIVQSVDESSGILVGSARPHECSQQKSTGGESQATDESATSAPIKPGLHQGSIPIQGCDSNEHPPENGASEADDTSHNEGDTQDPFSDISWEGWGLIKTPDGNYLPETFNPFGFEDLTGVSRPIV